MLLVYLTPLAIFLLVAVAIAIPTYKLEMATQDDVVVAIILVIYGVLTVTLGGFLFIASPIIESLAMRVLL